MAYAVGLRRIQVLDERSKAPFPVLLFYPTTDKAQPFALGPYTIEVASGGAVADGVKPLVVISHGSGGTPETHRGLALHLASFGFVVAAVEHPGNNRHDNSRDRSVANLTGRPRHLRDAMDAVLSLPDLAAKLPPDRVGLIGHSMGGYTALALAGGEPHTLPEVEDQPKEMLNVPHDPRVKALVLLAPATPWFLAAATLSNVTQPILLVTGEKDTITTDIHAQIVNRGLPEGSPLIHQIIDNAGHFSFLAPFPAHLATPDFAPAQDPEGFDRPAFHAALYADVQRFLTQHLAQLN